MPDTYDHITLMCRLKAAQRRNKELESGERYIQLEELYQKEYNVYEHKIEKLKKNLQMRTKKRSVCAITGFRYWRICSGSLKRHKKGPRRNSENGDPCTECRKAKR